MWTTIVEARTLEEFEESTPAIQSMPKGMKGRLVVEAWGIGPLADLWGVEMIASRFLPVGAEVTGVWGEGWSRAVIEFESDPIWVLALIGVIVSFLVGLGLSIYLIKLMIELTEKLFAGGMPYLLVAGVLGGGFLLLRMRRRRQKVSTS